MFKRLAAWLTAQRDADRRMLIDIMDSYAKREDRNTELVIEQTKLLQMITNLYSYSGEPTTWTVRDKDEFEAEQEREKPESEALID